MSDIATIDRAGNHRRTDHAYTYTQRHEVAHCGFGCVCGAHYTSALAPEPQIFSSNCVCTLRGVWFGPDRLRE